VPITGRIRKTHWEKAELFAKKLLRDGYPMPTTIQVIRSTVHFTWIRGDRWWNLELLSAATGRRECAFLVTSGNGNVQTLPQPIDDIRALQLIREIV
jgi:hypothetical protein